MRIHRDRRLAAVMFADIVGFTALMQENEQLGLQTRVRYRDVLEGQHEAFGGRIAQYYGDGALSYFPNSVDAVMCATAMQKLLRQPLEVPVRIGLHVGNVIVESSGLIGDAVNIASRIESFGISGGVFVSDSVHDQVRNQPQLGFVNLGTFKLKNVGRPFEIFAVPTDDLEVPSASFLDGKGERFASLPSNPPDPGGPLLGRDADLSALVDLLERHRVVTVTGPGGVGKIRTAIEVCRRCGGRTSILPRCGGRLHRCRDRPPYWNVNRGTVGSRSRRGPILESRPARGRGRGFTEQEGIANAYAEGAPELDYLQRARAQLSPDDIKRATEVGRTMSTNEALALARGARQAAD